MNGNLGELERLAAGVTEFCAANSLGDEAEFQLNLVLEELFVNSVRHGGCEGVPGAAHVRLRCAPDGVEVEYRDRGRPFDPTAAPQADIHSPLQERRAAGWEFTWSAESCATCITSAMASGTAKHERAAGTAEPVRESERLKNL